MKFFRPVQNRFYWLNSNDAVKISHEVVSIKKTNEDDTTDSSGDLIINAISEITDVITTKFSWKLPPINVINGEITLNQITSVNTDPDQIYCIRLRNIKGENIYDSSGNDHILYLNSGMNDGILGGSTTLQISNKIVDQIDIEISQKNRVVVPLLNNLNEIEDKVIYSNYFIDGVNTKSFESDTYRITTSSPDDDFIYNTKVAARTLYVTTIPNKNIHFTIGINIKDYNQEDLVYADYKPDLKQKLSKLII